MPKSEPPSRPKTAHKTVRVPPPRRGPAAGTPAVAKPARKSAAATSAPKRVAAGSRGNAAGQVPHKPVAKTTDPAARLKARIRRLTADLARAEGRIAELEGWAETDFLLDILNRRGFERELNRATAYIRRYGATGALISLDVDRLKPINDTYGHAAGDAVLKGIVTVVLRHIRSSDVVGRLGGDEFAVLLWNLSEADAQAKAAALEQAIDRLTFVFRGRSLTAGASTGVAVLGPEDDAVAALERADRAMYARKQIRRDRVP